MKPYSVTLDATLRCQDAIDFEDAIRGKVVGQDEAVAKTTEAVQKYMSGFSAQGRPLANMLFLGPTGTGKTRLVESVAEILVGDVKAVIKVDCAEFQASHDISKIVGAPPGYVGHNDRNTKPLISQEKLDKYSVDGKKLGILLFDEVEKASSALWNLLLGITDKATLTTGSGDVIDFSHTLIFMTSNLGATQISKELGGGLGFSNQEASNRDMQEKVNKTAIEAARKAFSPEFMNRLDHTVVFHTLQRDQLLRILRLEMNQVQRRILHAENHVKFAITYTSEAADFLLQTGTDSRYGARQLKRVLEGNVVNPISNMVMTGQIEFGDLVVINAINNKLHFEKIPAEVIKSQPREEWADFRPAQD